VKKLAQQKFQYKTPSLSSVELTIVEYPEGEVVLEFITRVAGVGLATKKAGLRSNFLPFHSQELSRESVYKNNYIQSKVWKFDSKPCYCDVRSVE
jgi:hypothetical protein